MKSSYLTIRLDEAIKRELVQAAKKEERTLSFFCARVLRQYVAKVNREKKP